MSTHTLITRELPPEINTWLGQILASGPEESVSARQQLLAAPIAGWGAEPGPGLWRRLWAEAPSEVLKLKAGCMLVWNGDTEPEDYLFERFETAHAKAAARIRYSLGQYGSEARAARWIELLSHERSLVRLEAARALEAYLDLKPVRKALSVLLYDPMLEVSSAAALALCAVPYAEKLLEDWLNEHLYSPEARGQSAALEVIGRLRLTDFLPSVLPFLDHANRRLLFKAIRTLERMKDPAAAEPLKQFIGRRFLPGNSRKIAYRALWRVTPEQQRYFIRDLI